MQHEFEQSIPAVTLPGNYESEDDALLKSETQIGSRLEIRRREKPSPTLWRLALMIGDGLVLLIALALLLMLAPYFNLALHISWNEPGTWMMKLLWGCIALISWSIAVTITQAQDLRSASNRLKSPLMALFGLVLMFICWIVLIYPFIAYRIASSIMTLLLFLLVAALALSAWRIAFAEFMRLPRFRTQGVIIGVNSAGETIARECRRLKRPEINILGYIGASEHESIQNDGLPVLGGKKTLNLLMQDGLIDIIIMAIDYKTDQALFQEAIEAVQFGISLIPMAVAYERISGKIPVEHVSDQWYLALPVELVASPLYFCWRKILDVTFGLFGMVVLILLLPILSLLIYLGSPGPIFYQQERLGRNGRKFSIYKFRSMYANAEQIGHAIWATRDDARITRIGRVLRNTHLDELPQVLNILRGEMSLIGPRPEREAFVIDLEQTIPFYRCRLMVKPGLTGWAQVKYCYANSNLDALEKLQYDLYYIKHQSLLLDVFIILKTILEVLSLHGT